MYICKQITKNMVKRTIIFVVFLVMSSNSYCQTISLIQLVAKFQKARVELDRINPYETPDLCLEKSNQIIDLYNQISQLDSTQIQQQILFEPYSMAAYSYYGKKEIGKAIPYLEKANLIAINNASQLLQKGYTYDALLGIATLLRDAYTYTHEYDKALLLSAEIISVYEKVNPRRLAFQQMANSQIYKAKDDVLKVIESDLKALDFFEKYGNDVQGFYSESLVNEILESYMYIDYYDDALAFIDNNRDRLNRMFGGKDDLEYEKLNQTNKYLYRIYEHNGLYQRAVNAAFLVSNYIHITEGENTPNYASWMNNAACSYLDLYESEDNPVYLNKADTLFNIAGEKWTSIPNREEISAYATYLGNYGNFLSAKHLYDKAEAFLQKSLALYEQQNSSVDLILSAKSRLATLYGNNGSVEKSISLHKELLENFEQQKDTLQIARTCNLLSQLYWMDLNNEELGEHYANKAYEILHHAHISNELSATITENLARIYYLLGLEERALQYSIESLKIKEKIGIGISLYELLNAREFYLDNYSELFYYHPDGKENVVDNVESLCNYILDNNSGNTREEKILRWKSKTVLGKAYMFFHRFEEAESQFLGLLKIEEDLWGQNSSNYIVTLNNLAYCCSLKGDYEKCRNYSLECINQGPTHKNYENVLSSSIAIGDSAMVEKYLPLTFNASLDYLKSQFLYLGTAQREELIENGGTFGFSNFALPASVYPKSKICAEYAYNSALVYKGILLNTEKDVDSTISAVDDASLKMNWKNLKLLQKQLQNTSDSVNSEILRRQIELKEKAILSILREYDDFTKNLDLDWHDIQSKLGNNDIAIEFVEYGNSLLSANDTTQYYGAVILRKEWASPKFLLLSKKSDIDSIIRNIISEFNEGKGYDEIEWHKISLQVYKNVWSPIMQDVDPNDKVYFSPVGMLHLAPLEALMDENGTPLNERCELYRMSSTKYLCLSPHQSTQNKAVLYGGLVYDSNTTPSETMQTELTTSGKREGWQYLKSTDEEVDSIVPILTGNHISTQLFKNKEGTEETFKQLSGKNISFLHVATHGFYFDANESETYKFFKDLNLSVKRGVGGSTLLRTGLMLSGGQQAWLHGKKAIPKGEEDGILLASEISLLDLHNVDLVTLSACQTGLGDLSSDGVMGLQRGFKRAGVNSLLMTLWPVDDNATQILMKRFYHNIVTGKGKRQSLISAQKYLREYNDGYYGKPRYWAAFILLDGIN